MLLETPYDCLLDLVIEQQEEPPAYIIRRLDGHVTGALSSAECSPENLEAAIINPPPAPAAIPEELPSWRLRAVASLASLTSAIAAALAALTESARTAATKVWHNGNTICCDSALVAQLAAARAVQRAS